MIKRIQKLLGTYTIEKLMVVPYRSYGTAYRLYVKGRVLDNPPLQIVKKQSFWKTLKNTFQQFDTHEVAHLKIGIAVGHTTFTTEADTKGYFLFDAILPDDIRSLLDPEGWVQFSLHIEGEEHKFADAESFKGEFLVPETEADFGIISDIDDTILSTGVTSFLKWKVLINSLFVNTYQRIPLEGAPQLYRKLHLGVDNKEKNPIFYLSNSPWNMYQYLKLFLDHNNFPKGPILLRSFNSIFQKVAGNEKPHKQKEIINILNTYTGLNFILIGDSGEHDASIYTEIAAQFPDRLLCIYLRSVNHRRKMQHVKSIVDNFRTTPVVLVETSAAVEIHAKECGFI
jgi:phosphatidate phosphatase APP1